MLAFALDVNGPYEVRWPRTDDKACTLAEKYIDYEKSLPTDQQIPWPPLSRIEELFRQVAGAVTSATDGETSRATAAETFRQSMAEAKPLLDKAIVKLKGQYVDNLAQLEAWGLSTRKVRGKVSVLKPTTENGWVDFLTTYVPREKSLDAAQRLSDPPLEKMEDLEKKVSSSLKVRDKGRADREVGVETRRLIVEQLVELLQVSAAGMVVMRYNYQVSKELKNWGFEVVERSNGEAGKEGG